MSRLLCKLWLLNDQRVDPVLDVGESTPLVELHTVVWPSIIHDLYEAID